MEKKDFCKLLKADMNNLLSHNFQYGMSMTGVLRPSQEDRTAVFAVTPEELCLTYLCKTNRYKAYLEQKIPLHWDAREYGNTNAHILCPECGRKTLALYNSGISFMCRQCTRDLHAQGLNGKERTARIFSYIEKGTITEAVLI